MSTSLDDFSSGERRLCELIAAYHQAVEAGQAPALETFIRQHPDLAVELSDFFRDHEDLHQAAQALRDAGQSGRELITQGHAEPLTHPEAGPPGDAWADELDMLCEPGRCKAGGRRFGDYELLERLAIGGMGVIYKARQVSLDRLVALKMIRAGQFASEADVHRFHDEARTVAELDHPHIVPIYEVGEVRGYHFFSMKLLEGQTLAAGLDRYRSDLRAAAQVTATLARAILHAHSRGILHRDLKPSNVLLEPTGQPLIADFGLAKHLDGAADLTATDAIVGTPPYFAPELTLGRKGAITPRTDIYGLGAILYALLTGRAPFRGESVWEMIEQVKERLPVPPRRINPRVDVDLQTICLKCLEKDPAGRYASARELAEDLERWLRGEPIVARRPNWRHRLWLWSRRPARNQEAGAFALTMGLVLTALAIIRLTLTAIGLVDVPSPRLMSFHVCLMALLGSIPMAWFGCRVLARRDWALRSGLIHSAWYLGMCFLKLFSISIFRYQVVSEQDTPLHSAMLAWQAFVVALVLTRYVVASLPPRTPR